LLARVGAGAYTPSVSETAGSNPVATLTRRFSLSTLTVDFD